MAILVHFRRYRTGSVEFRQKIATLLQTMVENGRWADLGDSMKIADMLGCLRDIDVFEYRVLFEQIFNEFKSSLEKN